MSAAHRFNNALKYRSGADIGQVMLTPPYVLEPVRAALGGRIGLDPCTGASNPTRAEVYFCLPIDGAAWEWGGSTVFCNPPYGAARGIWVKKSIESGAVRPTALLMPAHSDTKMFQLAAASCDFVCLINTRVKFAEKRANGMAMAASHGSAVFCWKCDPAPLRALGVILKAEK